MSLSSAILKSVRRRLGFSVVIAGSALATALVTGNSTVAVVVAVAVVFVGTIIARTKSTDRTQSRRAPGEPYSASYEWKIDRALDLSDVAKALSQRLNLQVKKDGRDVVVLQGGSQFWLRLIGGYFINPAKLPVQAELRSTKESGVDQATVQLSIRDAFGIAVRDEALEDRFALAAGRIRETVEAELSALGGVEIAFASLPQ